MLLGSTLCPLDGIGWWAGVGYFHSPWSVRSDETPADEVQVNYSLLRAALLNRTECQEYFTMFPLPSLAEALRDFSMIFTMRTR